MIRHFRLHLVELVCLLSVGDASCLRAEEAVPIRSFGARPALAANVVRVIDTLRLIGAPLNQELETALTKAAKGMQSGCRNCSIPVLLVVSLKSGSPHQSRPRTGEGRFSARGFML